VYAFSHATLKFGSKYISDDMAEAGSVVLPLVNQFLPLQLRVLAQERVILCLIMGDVIINNDRRSIRHGQTADCQGAVRVVSL